MIILTGNPATLLLSIVFLVFCCFWAYKTGWLIRTTYKHPIVGFLHSIASGVAVGFCIWLIFFIHFRLQ